MKRSLKLITVFSWLLALILFSSIVLAASMSKPVGRDEQMYTTAGVLINQGNTIYKDFSYPSQMPYHPLLYAAVFKVSGTTYYLLLARMVSVVSNIAVILCILGIYKEVFKSFPASGNLFGLAAAALYVFNPFVDYSNGYAWNHDVVIACVMLSLWLFISIDFSKKSQYVRLAAIGALLTLASCMRITTVLVELLFTAALLAAPAVSKTARLKRLLPFSTAAAVVLVWPVWIIAQAPEAFYLNLVKIPALYAQWLERIGLVHDKLQLLSAGLTMPGFFVLIILAIYLGIASRVFSSSKITPETVKPAMPWLLTAAFFVIAFIPPTMWRQYLAMPVPFLVTAMAYPLLSLRMKAQKGKLSTHFKAAGVITALCVAVAVIYNMPVLYRIPLAFTPDKWVPVRVHEIAQDIGKRVPPPKRLLTLGPLYALEAGCGIYPQLSAGSIVYRVGDYMPPRQRKLTNTTGTESLNELLEKNQPSAVLLNVESKYFKLLEEPLKKAIKPGWIKKTYQNGLILYYQNNNQQLQPNIATRKH